MTDASVPTRGGKAPEGRGNASNVGTRGRTFAATDRPSNSNIQPPQRKTSKYGRPLEPYSKFSERSYDLGTSNQATPDQAVPDHLATFDAAIGESLGATKRGQQRRQGRPRSQPRNEQNLGIKINCTRQYC